MPVPDLMPALGPQKYYERDKWTARHALACDLHIAGANNNKIAEVLEVSPATISIWLSDERSSIYIFEKRQNIAGGKPMILEEMEKMAPRVLEVIREDLYEARETISKETRALRSKSAWNVLSSLGYGPMQKRLVGHVNLPADMLERSRETIEDLREIKAKFAYASPPPADAEDSSILGLKDDNGQDI
jgi:predicted transcriptional regulator